MLLLATASSTETSLLRDSKIKPRAAVNKSTFTSFCIEKSLNGQHVEMMPDYIGQNCQRSCATQNIMSLAKKDINLNESSFVLNSRRLKKDKDSSNIHTPSLKNVDSMSNDESRKIDTAKVQRTNASKKLIGTFYALPPSIFHKQVEKYRNSECCSVDNFNKEMCHFRPIRLAPISPWKCGANMPRRGVILVPKTILGKVESKKYKKLIECNSVTNILLKNSRLSISPKSAFVSTINLSTTETDQRKRRRTTRNNTNNVKTVCDLTLSNKPNKDTSSSSSSTTKSHPPKRSINKPGRKKSTATKKTTSCSSSPPLTRSRLRELRKKNLPNSLQYFGLL